MNYPFHKTTQRPIVTNRILEFLDGSEIIAQKKAHVQDPYWFRCMPQVHGASKDAIDYVKKYSRPKSTRLPTIPIFLKATRLFLAGISTGNRSHWLLISLPLRWPNSGVFLSEDLSAYIRVAGFLRF
jgi:histidine ammonia-lyase